MRKAMAIGAAMAAISGAAPLVAEPPYERRFEPVEPSRSRRAKVKAARRQARKNRKRK